MKHFLQLVTWATITIVIWLLAIFFSVRGIYIGMKLSEYITGTLLTIVGAVFAGIGVGLTDQWHNIWIKRKDVDDEYRIL